MFRKLANLVVLVPLAIVLILLSVANRQAVTFSLDPTNVENPAIAVSLPFFVFLFLAVFLGMFLGSGLTWLGQGKHRKALREKAFEADMLKRQASNNPEQEVKSSASEKPDEIAPGLPAVRNS